MLLRQLAEADRMTLTAFKVTEAQSAFVEPISELLATTGGERESYVMDVDETIVGFFQIDSISGNQCVANNLELHEVFIDENHQGKGHGRKFVSLLAEFLKERYPSFSRVCLTVNCRNINAKRLYELGGFIESGELKTEGRSGPQFIMYKVI